PQAEPLRRRAPSRPASLACPRRIGTVAGTPRPALIDADAECGCLMHKTIVTCSGASRIGTPARYLEVAYRSAVPASPAAAQQEHRHHDHAGDDWGRVLLRAIPQHGGDQPTDLEWLGGHLGWRRGWWRRWRRRR